MKFNSSAAVALNPRNPAEPEYPALTFYKINPEAVDPAWGTDDAACFDISACLSIGAGIQVYRPDNRTRTEYITPEKPYLTFFPAERAKIPTGLIFDIPYGFDVKIYSRSGLSLKRGLTLTNKVGVVDFGYVEESFIILTNESAVAATITHGERIAQGQMKRDFSYRLYEIKERPAQKTDRIGGFGSTGTEKLAA